MTVGSVSVGLASLRPPADPRVFIRAPRALFDALEALGVDVQPLPVGLHPKLEHCLLWPLVTVRARSLRDLADPHGLRRRERRNVYMGPALTGLRNRKVRRAVRHARVTAAIQVNTDFRLPPCLPYVTWDDSTLLQARRAYPWPYLQRYSDATFDSSVARGYACYTAARTCCAASHWAARSIVEDYGQARERVKVVGVGNFQSPKPVLRRDWRRPRFLFVGLDWKRKNGDRTVAAFAAVRERYPDAELHLVGRHPRVGLHGVVNHGVLPPDSPVARARLAELFERATCLVLPSLHEPCAKVYVEAAAAGIASIGTISGGAVTVIGEAGRLVNPHSQQEIIEAMGLMCEPEVAASLGALALERSKLFTWRKVGERLLRALALPGVDQAQLADFL